MSKGDERSGRRRVLNLFLWLHNRLLNEVNLAAKLIYSTANSDANVIFGALIDETLEDNISITVLATGFTERGRDSVMTAARTKDASLDTTFNDVKRQGMRSKRGSSRADEEDKPVPAVGTPSALEDDGSKIPGFLKNLKKRR